MQYTFKEGQCIIKHGRKHVAKVTDKAFYIGKLGRDIEAQKADVAKYPYSLYIHSLGAARDCESLEVVTHFIDKYITNPYFNFKTNTPS